MIHKGIIIAIKNNLAIVLLDNFTYIEIPRKPSMVIGDTISLSAKEIKRIKLRKIYFRISMVATILFVVSLISLFLLKKSDPQYVSEYAIINIDLKTSIEFVVDSKYIVKKAIVLDSISNNIISTKPYINKNFDNAFNDYIKTIDSNGLFDKSSEIVLSAALNSDSTNNSSLTKLLDNLKNNLNNFTSNQSSIFLFVASPNDLKKAKEYKLSLGKYVLYNEMVKYGSNISTDNISNMSTDEIMQMYYRSKTVTIESPEVKPVPSIDKPKQNIPKSPPEGKHPGANPPLKTIPELNANTPNDNIDGAIVAIKNYNSNLYLTVKEKIPEQGSNVEQLSRTNKPISLWKINYINNGYGYYYINSQLADGKTFFLDVLGGYANPGKNIQIEKFNNTNSQLFKIVKNEDFTYTILTKSSKDKCCITVENSAINEGANIEQNIYTNSNSQKWILEKVK